MKFSRGYMVLGQGYSLNNEFRSRLYGSRSRLYLFVITCLNNEFTSNLIIQHCNK